MDLDFYGLFWKRKTLKQNNTYLIYKLEVILEEITPHPPPTPQFHSSKVLDAHARGHINFLLCYDFFISTDKQIVPFPTPARMQVYPKGLKLL